MEEVHTLFSIPPLYKVEYVSAASGAHRHRMHADERTNAAALISTEAKQNQPPLTKWYDTIV